MVYCVINPTLTIILLENVRTFLTISGRSPLKRPGRRCVRNLNFFSSVVAQPVDWMLLAAVDCGLSGFLGADAIPTVSAGESVHNIKTLLI